jgi:hypothetical protein
MESDTPVASEWTQSGGATRHDWRRIHWSKSLDQNVNGALVTKHADAEDDVIVVRRRNFVPNGKSPPIRPELEVERACGRTNPSMVFLSVEETGVKPLSTGRRQGNDVTF